MRLPSLPIALAFVIGACGGPAIAPEAPAAAAPARPASPMAPADRVALLRTLAAETRGHEHLDVQHRLYAELARNPDPAARAEALAIIEQIVASPDFATWERADAALHDLGVSRGQAGDRTGARRAWQRLVAAHPGSRFAPPAHLALAEAAFDDADLSTAELEYRAVLRAPEDRSAPYARYKLAWVHFNRQAYDDALAGFVEVVRTSADPLRREALKDVVRVYAQVNAPADAVAFFDALERGQGPAMTLRLAELYADQGRVDEAAAAYLLAVPLTDVDGACRAARGLDELERLAGPHDGIDAARAALADWHLPDTCLRP